MPVVPGAGGQFAGQSGQLETASSTQSTFRQMCGEIKQWRPDAPDTMVEKWVQNAYRAIIDERNWFGLLVRGVFSSANIKNGGTVSVTAGSTTVTGVGTDFSADDVGRQFRTGFATPCTTIASVEGPTGMTLEVPWGSADVSGSSYSIFTQLAILGPNVKRVKSMVNQLQGYRLRLDTPSQQIDAWDTWRTAVGYTRFLASASPSPKGEPRWELWPIPTVRQPFPFLAYVQPDDLSDDTYPLAWIRTDLIVLRALSDALMFKRDSPYYDPQVATWKRREYMAELEKMIRDDDNRDPKDLIWNFEQYPIAYGGMWAQEHDV